MTDPVPLKEDAARRATINFVAAHVRAGFHATGQDILETITQENTPDAGTSFLIGACQFVAEIHERSAEERGLDKAAFRKIMLDAIGETYDQFCQMSVIEAAGNLGEPTEQ